MTLLLIPNESNNGELLVDGYYLLFLYSLFLHSSKRDILYLK